MTILPINEKKPTVDVPRNFFFYGATMSGKSKLAEMFPAPLFLNTDGNAKANPAPSIQLMNKRGLDGRLVEKGSVIDQLEQIILELQNLNNKEQYQYRTIIVDVIDDVCQLIEQAVCLRHGVNALSEMGWGDGYTEVNNTLANLVNDLKLLDVNVIYISRVDYDGEDKIEVPSLKPRYYNKVNGNCDLVVHTRKMGQVYKRNIEHKRKTYYASRINDPQILRILQHIDGALAAEKPAAEAAKKKA